ncbi:MAG: hypothetical protein E6G97_06540 [Alphaproteobacteria bacterium]|nr:MAG: hypothetical protein E6G97_06540 [Alphaproteobacteria bacterium]
MAQSASSVGSGGASAGASGSAATGGTAGSGAAGGTSASTLGTGGTSTSPTGTTSATIGTAGSAAGGTKDTSRSKVNGNANNLHGHSMARAQDGGTWSRSMTQTKVHKGEVRSRTRTMAHQPGGAPVKSTTGINTGQ